ncbi:hypothetical protein ABMV07_10580 [Corynebacterium belfantii]|uniref:hypothetical protein n=1 Tax=Corynebacterium belfantii TaxID=2014537 RepID=UPI0035A8883D
MTRQLEEKRKRLTANENLRKALDECIAGRNYNSNKPDGPNKPDDKRALPSTNGAVIGAIVAVLGILAAALPFIKSILPAQLRALLP